jgi:hypothetical protein
MIVRLRWKETGMKTFISTEDGHILVCLALIGIAAAMHWIGWQKADDVLVFALGVLARCMTSKPQKPEQP